MRKLGGEGEALHDDLTANSKCSLSNFPPKSSLSEDFIPGMVVKAVKNYSILVGFGRACAPVRCAHPSFWDHPAHGSFAASY
jgi:hypothetical protein